MFEYTEQEIKAFAVEYIKDPNEPFKAASEVWPDDAARSLYAAQVLCKTPEFQKVVNKLRDSGTKQYNKEQLRDELVTDMKYIVKNSRSSADDKVKATKMIAELYGMIDKGSNDTNVNMIFNRVIAAPMFDNNEDWEKAGSKQQSDLLNVSRTRH